MSNEIRLRTLGNNLVEVRGAATEDEAREAAARGSGRRVKRVMHLAGGVFQVHLEPR